jgi:predicted nucleic acid-binding protein
MALVLDTGPILALLDATDPDHERCAGLVGDTREPLVVVGPTLVEIDYWIRKRLQPVAWTVLVEDIALGAYRLENLGAEDLLRVAELESKYGNLGLGMVDASVIAICERLQEEKVATLDHRHFGVVKPRHCKRLRLLPE